MSDPRPRPELPAELRARLLDEVARAPAPTRAAARSRHALGLGLALGVTALLVAVTGGVHADDRAPEGLSRVGLAWALVAAFALAAPRLARPRGRVEPLPALLVRLALLVVLTLGAALVGLAPFARVLPATAGENAACLVLGLVYGLAPALALAAPWRGRLTGGGRALGAALGAAAGALGALAVHLHCPRDGLVHGLVGHVGVAAALALLGALAGPALELRAAPPAAPARGD